MPLYGQPPQGLHRQRDEADDGVGQGEVEHLVIIIIIRFIIATIEPSTRHSLLVKKCFSRLLSAFYDLCLKVFARLELQTLHISFITSHYQVVDIGPGLCGGQRRFFAGDYQGDAVQDYAN